MAATILVADADKTLRELMASVLAREGFGVVAAHDAADVVARCKAEAPALVVCSAALPGAEAVRWCGELKVVASSTRIVLLVGGGELDASDPTTLAGVLGCDAVLPRPFRYPALREQLGCLGIALPGRKEARAPGPTSFSVPVAEPPAFELAAIAAPEPPAPGAPASLVPPVPDASVLSPGSPSAIPIPIPLGAPLDATMVAALAVPFAPLAPAEAPASARPAPATPELDLDALAPEADHRTAAELPLDDLLAAPPEAAAAPRPAAFSALELPAPDSHVAVSPAPALELELDAIAEPAARVVAPPAPTASDAPAPPAPALAGTDAGVPRQPFFSIPAPARAVERKHNGVVPPSLAREGQLESVPLPRLLFELYVATFSGTLRLEREGVARTIYVWGGLPVRVDSDRAEESIGRLLVEHGRITQEQYEAALALATERHVGEADALLACDFIRRGELLDILRDQTELRLVNSFSWRDGAYRIHPDTQFGDPMVLSEVHPLKSIWRGVSEHYDLVSLMTFFGAMRGRYVVGTTLFEVHFDSLGPFLRNLDVAALLDGKTTFEAALRSDDSRALEMAQALYVLLVTDMVRASPTPGDPVTLPERDEAELSMSAPVDYRAITRVCDDVNREYLRVKESDYFDALRVEMGGGAEAVDAAYNNIVRPFTLEALPQGLPEDVQRRAAELCSILARARKTLRDPELRERYVEAQRARYLTADAAPGGGAPRAPTPGFVTDVDIDLDRAADQERETRQLAERAHADAQRLFKSGDHEMAQQKLAVAVRLNPREPGYRVALARVILAANDGDGRRQAATLMQQALKLDPSHVEANFELAKLLVAVGQGASARPYVMRVLQRAPEHREARALLAEIAS